MRRGESNERLQASVGVCYPAGMHIMKGFSLCVTGNAGWLRMKRFPHANGNWLSCTKPPILLRCTCTLHDTAARVPPHLPQACLWRRCQCMDSSLPVEQVHLSFGPALVSATASQVRR